MELCSLHPFDPGMVQTFVRLISGDGDARPAERAGLPAGPWSARLLAEARIGYGRAREGSEAGANAVSYAFAQYLATATPSYLLPGAGFTPIEARIDRGVGMLMRPPSRLFADAGLDSVAARAMPIRLDLTRGLMGGAFVPARLVPELHRLLDKRLDRFLRRFIEAEMDGVALVGALLAATETALAHGWGLYEAMDVVTPDMPEADPPGSRVVVANRKELDKDLRKRLEAAAKPPKQPGMIGRLLGRGNGPA
jgi:predicted NBD/HSP70 family sugar kinase